MKKITNEIEVVFEYLTDIVFFVKRFYNDEYRITFTNEVFNRLLNPLKIDYTELNIKQIFPQSASLVIVSTIDKVSEEGKRSTVEISIEQSGVLNSYETTVIPITESEGELYFLIICHDITKSKNYEEQLRRVKQEAEESSKLKDSLLLNINHEFRTPLHGILGISEMLNEEITDANQKAMIKRITNSGRRLLNTLVSIIELSRLESSEKKVYSTKVSLADVVSSVCEKYKLEAEQKGINFYCEVSNNSLKAHLDESLLRIVITNLVDNAVKFTNKGSVTVALDIDENGFAVIRVVDTGIGISKKNLDKIFTAFIQESEGVGRSHEGIGVGLTLVKQMTLMMGGAVFVESEKNVGSKFSLRFPSISDEKQQYQLELSRCKTRVSVNGNELPYILLVEDNEMSSMLTKTFLREKYWVDIAENAVEALKLVRQKNYSAVLLDINLGSGMNGVDLLKEIRSYYNYLDTPIIAMTGYAFNSDKVNFLNSGFTNYIAKPFSKKQLLDLLEETLSIAV